MYFKRLYLLVFLVLSLFSIQLLALEPENIDCSISFANQIEPVVVNELFYSENNRIFVPMRKIFELLGATVQWNKEDLSITATKYDNTMITMQIQEDIAQITTTSDVKEVHLDSPPKILNGSTFVPLRFVSEALGCEVEWIAELSAVHISSTSSFLHQGDVTYWFDGNTTGGLYVQSHAGTTRIAILDVDTPQCYYWLNSIQNSDDDEFIVSVEGTQTTPTGESNKNFLDRYYISNVAQEKTTTTIDNYYILSEEELDVNKIQFFQEEFVWLPGDNIVLQIDRSSGKAIKKYTLSNLTNIDSAKGHYYVWTNGRYLLIRVRADFKDSGSKTMYPVLIDLNTDEIKWLHKTLVPPTELAFYESKEASDQNLLLLFQGEKKGNLIFTYISLDGTKTMFSYDLNNSSFTIIN